MKKKLTLGLALMMAFGICCFGIMPVAAADVPTPVVTSGTGAVYADNGVTVISAPIDVFVSVDPNTAYYYLINDIDPVDVYYSGVTDNPGGSYFDGPLANGAFVMAIGTQVDKFAGAPINSTTGNRITIPAQSSVLTVIAYKNDVTSDIYRHVFRLFKAENTGNRITATVDTEKELALGFGIYIGVYTPKGALQYLDYANYTASGTLTTDLSAYPLGKFKYKVFWWDKNLVPLGKEKSFE